MSFNPLEQKGIPLDQQFRSWSELNVTPYDKNTIHPYSRSRIIVMNGIEVESIIFGHHFNRHTVDPLTRMHAMTITAGEQQTMNFYMNHGPDYMEPIARGLNLEIAMIEEQHVTQYESLLDPLVSMLEDLVFHKYNEVYM